MSSKSARCFQMLQCKYYMVLLALCDSNLKMLVVFSLLVDQVLVTRGRSVLDTVIFNTYYIFSFICYILLRHQVKVKTGFSLHVQE